MPAFPIPRLLLFLRLLPTTTTTTTFGVTFRLLTIYLVWCCTMLLLALAFLSAERNGAEQAFYPHQVSKTKDGKAKEHSSAQGYPR